MSVKVTKLEFRGMIPVTKFNKVNMLMVIYLGEKKEPGVKIKRLLTGFLCFTTWR